MKIKKININNFGLINKKSINFENGINIVYCESDQIKFIIQNFIVCFLYGMDDERKAFKSVFRRKYSPFFIDKTKGELIVEINNIEYCIERTFGISKSNDTSIVKRMIDGEKIFNVDLDQPGKTFLDIGFEAFNRTMFLKNIDEFGTKDKNFKLMADVAKIKENFDNRFSFDRSIELINKAKCIIKDIKISENLGELYEKYSDLNEKLHRAVEIVNLNNIDYSKLDGLKKRKEVLLTKYSLIGDERKYFKYLDIKKNVNDILNVENEINKIKQDIKNVNDSIPKMNEKIIDNSIMEDIITKFSNYREGKKEILNVNKIDVDEESNAIKRFEYLNKQLDRYSDIKSNFLFYSERVKKIEMINKEIDNIKGNGRLSYLLKQYKIISRVKKNKQKDNDLKIYISIIIVSILITILAPLFKINISSVILISLIAFGLIGLSYVYMMFKDYKEIGDKDLHRKAGKFYELKDQISKLEKELYPYSYYKLRTDIKNIKNIENELDSLSYRFKSGDLSYTSVIKDFKKKEDEILEILANFGFDDIYIRDIENFIDNMKFKLNYKSNIEKDLESKSNELLKMLNGREKSDLINELSLFEQYSNVEVFKDKEDVEKEYNILKIELKEIDDDIKYLEDSLKSAESNKNRVSSINDEILNLRNTILYLENKIANIDTYRNRITDIYYEFIDTLSSEISNRVEYLIKYLTKDSISTSKKIYKYDRDNSSILLREKLGIEFLSGGMWDLIYFALRITIADFIYEYKGEIPLILDDLFLTYDSNRMKKALMILEKYSKDRQVILFTSTKREIDYLKGNAYIINV
ncbi:ATP-binding protein [Candidatus Arthromitus sp. SFB-rat-Yit]|uniref:ATP-binding protein n=1 Tax=Candidatus Arthromitus sp. SFB-rat-Yit TaxID=1041504 RepID=UPI000227A5F1|nr:hypothetical protein [Candidatus Arthromitus sp. SFB-rat-Yit]BAK81646.1 hypothetical protein RATSFB_1084 [Candidatus Arthromitus sp. SFB-rat-Yit]